ncbi:MAG TPA: A/G-specific adenine glycosylase [Myxococcota bacterium]|nr:A/G-specific adenine glycosylase [Myxococcota bacterium]
MLAWYRASRRDLPWRRTRDPYAIWVSESMLQQTRVETVLPYYGRFLARFPDVGSLARAELEQVLELWTGLGYYSRARNLHRAAREVVARHGGRLPDDADSLRALPGIGRYTAGAIASIAFDRAEPIVDGNVARVLSRLCGIREEIGTAHARRRLWDEAAALADGPHPGALNQALMELGATLCTPRAPRCGACPLKRGCDAQRAGDAEALPRKAPRARARAVEAVAGLVLRRGRALAVRRPERGLLAGLWELPGGDVVPGERTDAAIARTLGERVGLELIEAEPLGAVEHAFTHLFLRLNVFRCRVAPGRVRLRGPGAHRWLAPRDLRSLPQGGPTRKALALALAGAV